MSSFQDLGFFVHNNLETEAQRSFAQAALNHKTEREHVRKIKISYVINML